MRRKSSLIRRFGLIDPAKERHNAKKNTLEQYKEIGDV